MLFFFFFNTLPCDFLKFIFKAFITTHGIYNLLFPQLKMSTFFFFFFLNTSCNFGVEKTPALTAVIWLAKNKLLELRLVNGGVRAFPAVI